MFTLWTLFEASLLCLNAVCILNEERFMVKMGWGANQPQGFGDQTTVKSQLLNLVRSIRTVTRSNNHFYYLINRYDPTDSRGIKNLSYFTPTQKWMEWCKKSEVKCILLSAIPLIFLNILTIIFKLILG